MLPGRALRVEGEVVQLVVHVDGVKLPEVHQLLQSLVDEDDADEGGEGLFSEARDVADERAGVGGDQHEAEEGGPESDTGPQGQVGQTVVTEDRQDGTVSWQYVDMETKKGRKQRGIMGDVVFTGNNLHC